MGVEQLAARPSIIPSLFSIFTSAQHLSVLQEKENAVLVGTSIDELIRHHPALRQQVFDSLRATLSKIEALGNDFEVPEELRSWYFLEATDVSEGEDIPMADAEVTASHLEAPPTSASGQDVSSDIDTASNGDSAGGRPRDNTVVSFIDIIGRVRYWSFGHNHQITEFCLVPGGSISTHTPL